MIDHITFHVADPLKTATFYSAALKPLGYTMTFEDTFDGVKVIAFGTEKKTDTWFVGDGRISGPAHIAWKAGSRKEVDEFYDAALAAGGTDNGAPGLRAEYHENYYGAFVIDPDGNNVEVVFGN